MIDKGDLNINSDSLNEKKQTEYRLGAILFADAVDYSRNMHSDESATYDSLRDHLAVFEQLIGSHNGHLVERTGDGIFGFFDSATNALSYALDAQDTVAELDSSSKNKIPLKFRIGIHLGEVIVGENSLHGDSVNIASRVEKLSPPGGVCITAAVLEQVKSKIEVGYEYLGGQKLKNIEQLVEVYSIRQQVDAVSLRAAPRPSEEICDPDPLMAENPSVVVLPFENLTRSPDQQFFADGITEDIITNLSRFRGLLSIARGSSFTFRNSPEPAHVIARRLKARYVVNGSVRRAGNRVRINVNLGDSLLSRQVWAERYDRNLDDIFEIQDEITEISVGAMAVQIESAERARFGVVPPNNLDAYGYLLRGREKALHFMCEENQSARFHYEMALNVSPHYSRALAAISRTHNLDWRYNWSNMPQKSLDDALVFAQEAVEADPNDARGHSEIGFVRLYRKEHVQSLKAYERASTLNPNDADVLAEMADALTHSGRSEESLAVFQKAMRLNPFYPDQYIWDMAGAYLKLHRHEEAVDCILRMNNPTQGRRILASCYAHMGQIDNAREQAALIRQSQPNFSAETWANIIPDVRVEDVDHFIQGLKKAGL